MDTKQKNRDGGQSRRQRQSEARRPVQEERPRKQAAQQQKKRRVPEKEARKVPRPAAQQEQRKASRQEQRRPAPQQEQRRLPRQEQRPQTQQEQPRQIPQEEVYRPTPSQERHSQEARQDAPRRSRPAQSGARGAVASRSRAAGAKRRRPAQGSAKTRPTRRNVRPPRKNAPAVIYTQPAPFNLNRLLIQLLTVTSVVLALTMGLSVFFKVEVVTVSGTDVYSEWTVREASGISEGDALLTFSRARAAARIRAELPYVDQVRFGIKLPNTVIIDIEELDVVYAIQDKDGIWWFITSEGRVVEQTDGGTANNYTKITGIMLDAPIANEQAIAYETAAPTTEATTSTDASEDPLATAPVITTNADRLAVALMIVQALESNDVVGEVAKVDVSDLGSILLEYGTRFDVKLGDTENLDYKIACMKDAISQMSDHEMGVLDVTFDIWPDKAVVTPFTD